jgi:glycosyltransferase involved in cell wall biosynthesis
MIAVIWIDWYSYHVSRLRALSQHNALRDQVTGIELIGGCGVHSGLKFRNQDRDGLPITSLLPEADWEDTSQLYLAKILWRKLQQLKPSAVLVPGYYTAPALITALWAKLYRKRCVLMSETTRDDYARVWWRELPKRILVQGLFDSGIAGGEPHVRYLQQLGFPPERIARFYDVIDNEFYKDEADEARRTCGLRESLHLPDQYFLYVGRLASEKNVDGLIESFTRYRKSGGTWSLVMVGDGSRRRNLEAQCAALGISDHVRFEGLKSARESVRYFAFAGCFVLPSTREPWGLVVNEAMAAGLPVIVSRRCGCAEDLVSSGDNGYLFDPRQPDELAGLLSVMSLAKPETRDAMGQRSRQIIAGYSLQHWANEVARIVQ